MEEAIVVRPLEGSWVGQDGSWTDMAGSKSATATRGMVATAFPLATEAALEMLQAGGNAVDAAVAAAWALAVCEPSGSGLGGQTVLLIHLQAGKTVVLDGHSQAPAAVCREQVSRHEQKRGYRACTIPSTPATLGFAQACYGVLPPARVLEPAIRLAEDGYRITQLQRRQLRWCRADLRASPVASSLFLQEGRPFPVGTLFRQTALAATLRRLARYGTEDFYRGAIARAIAEDMKAQGGLLTEEDLAGLKLPVEREPLTVAYRGYEVVSVPPPGGGLQMLLGLKILERLDLDSGSSDMDTWYELLAQVTHVVFRERERWPVHPDWLTPSLSPWLLGDGRAEELAGALGNPRGQGAPARSEEAGETTHLCTADGEGNVVALTQSLQSLFGAKVANARCGFLYNNYLSTCPRSPHPYQLGGGCLPRSNAAPTLVLRRGWRSPEQGAASRGFDGKRFVALGAAGSRRITSALLHVLSGLVDRDLPLAEALALPRVHATLAGKVWIERPAATQPLRERLAKRFRAVRVRAPQSYSMGAVQAIQFLADGTLRGAADPRRDGTARGV
jgi:gamma-glutamyltranspeptidase/glutathione hydrolase